MVSPGGFSPDDWNVAGAIVECDRLPGWRFTVSLSLRDGRVLGLAIEATTSDAVETGITTTKLLRFLPLEDIVAAVRAANAERFLSWKGAQAVRVLEVDERGRTVKSRRVELAPDRVMRAAMREVAEPIRRNPRGRHQRQRLTDRRLAEEMDAYARAVAAGNSVTDFVKEARMSKATLDDHRKEAIRRGLFTSAGRGRAGGSLTDAGQRALRTKE